MDEFEVLARRAHQRREMLQRNLQRLTEVPDNTAWLYLCRNRDQAALVQKKIEASLRPIIER